MARPRRTTENSVSLFPFLSILACVIGVLTLVITSLSVSQIAASRENADVARAEDYQTLESHLEEMRVEIADLAKNRKSLMDKLKLEEEVTELQESMTAVPTIEFPELEEKLKEIDTMIAEQTATKKELEEKKDELEKKIVAFKKPTLLIQATGGTSNIKPLFVEARKEGLVIHSPSKSIPVKLADIAKNPQYKKLVDFTAERSKLGQTIVFLIREDGLSSFYRGRDAALAGGATTAKLPLIGQGPVNLAAFGIRRNLNTNP